MSSAAILHPHGGRRLTVPGVGLVELIQNADGQVDQVVTLELLTEEQHQRLLDWLRNEWPQRASGVWA